MDEKEKVEKAVPTPEAPAGVQKEEMSAPKADAKPAGVPVAGTVSGVNGPMPAELHGWSWGAFCLSWIWGIGNSTYIAFLVFVPFANVVMPFVLGAKGNEWAWTHRKFESVAQFKEVQKAWTIWGLVMLGLSILMSILFGAAMIALIGEMMSDANAANVNNTIVY